MTATATVDGKRHAVRRLLKAFTRPSWRCDAWRIVTDASGAGRLELRRGTAGAEGWQLFPLGLTHRQTADIAVGYLSQGLTAPFSILLVQLDADTFTLRVA